MGHGFAAAALTQDQWQAASVILVDFPRQGGAELSLDTYIYIYIYFTLWLFNIAMENGPFIDDFPIKPPIYKGFSMAMLNNQMVYINLYNGDMLGISWVWRYNWGVFFWM